MRALLPSLMLLAACAGGPSNSTPRPPPLPEGKAVYQVRYNPSACLADRPELHAEVKTPQGWERVALAESDDDLALVDGLLSLLRRDPQGLTWVRADLGDTTRTWPGNHAARTLSLIEVEVRPPSPEE